MPLLYCHLPTPLGEMLAIASGQGLCLLEFVGQKGVGASRPRSRRRAAVRHARA